jgi:hypothetical protein
MHWRESAPSKTYQSSADTKPNTSSTAEETTGRVVPWDSKDSTTCYLPYGASTFHGPRDGTQFTVESELIIQLWQSEGSRPLTVRKQNGTSCRLDMQKKILLEEHDWIIIYVLQECIHVGHINLAISPVMHQVS